jgi:hypothetical protein
MVATATPERVTILSWDESRDAVDTLLDSLVEIRDQMQRGDGGEGEWSEQIHRFGELARLLARLAQARDDQRDAEFAGSLPFGVHERPMVAYVEEFDPAALGIPTDGGYLGVALGFQAAIATHRVPETIRTHDDAAALSLLHSYGLALHVAALEAWREIEHRALSR